jgi:hypothetical protein
MTVHVFGTPAGGFLQGGEAYCGGKERDGASFVFHPLARINSRLGWHCPKCGLMSGDFGWTDGAAKKGGG